MQLVTLLIGASLDYPLLLRLALPNDPSCTNLFVHIYIYILYIYYVKPFCYCLCSESFEEIYKSEVYSLRVLLGGISWGLGRVSLGEETRSQRMKTDQQYAQKFYPFLNEFLPFLSFNLQVYCDINTFILLCGLWRSYNKWTFFSVVEFFQKVAMEDISNSDMLVKRLNLHKISSSLSRDWPLRNWFTDWPLSTPRLKSEKVHVMNVIQSWRPLRLEKTPKMMFARNTRIS